MSWLSDNKAAIGLAISGVVIAHLVYFRKQGWLRRLSDKQIKMPAKVKNHPKYAIIGGSGVTIDSKVKYAVDTPYGRCVNISFLNDNVIFVNRHSSTDDEAGGYGSYAPPHAVNFRAMLWALKECNVQCICAISSTGTLRPSKVPVGSVVMPDDYFMSLPKATTFWPNPQLGKFSVHEGEGGQKLGRIHFTPADPGDEIAVGWRKWVRDAVSCVLNTHGDKVKFAQNQTEYNWPLVTEVADIPLDPAIVYVNCQGPRFETRSEIRSYKNVGDVLGMTCGNEWILAQELCIPYVLLSAVDNSCNGLSTYPGGPMQEYLDHKGDMGAVMNRVVSILADAFATRPFR